MTDERKHPEGELTRLADGSLPADRQADLLAQIRQSPELTAALAEQERAVTMLRALDEPAPAALRARVDELTGACGRTRAPPRAGGARSSCPAPPPSRRPSRPWSSWSAAAPRRRPCPSRRGSRWPRRRSRRPAVNPNDSKNLALTRRRASPSPPGARRQGWTARRRPHRHRRTGARSPPSSTRAAAASGSATRSPTARRSPASHGETVTRYGVRFTLQHSGGASLISWVRSGHTCVIAGRSVSDAALLAPGHGRREPGGHELAGRPSALTAPTCSSRVGRERRRIAVRDTRRP